MYMLQNQTNTWDIPEKYIIIIHSMEVVGWLDVEHLSIEGGGDQLIQRRTHRIITLLPSAQPTLHQLELYTVCTLTVQSAHYSLTVHIVQCTNSHCALNCTQCCCSITGSSGLSLAVAAPVHSKFTSITLPVDSKLTFCSLQSTCQLQLTNCSSVLLIDITQRISKCTNDQSAVQAVMWWYW